MSLNPTWYFHTEHKEARIKVIDWWNSDMLIEAYHMKTQNSALLKDAHIANVALITVFKTLTWKSSCRKTLNWVDVVFAGDSVGPLSEKNVEYSTSVRSDVRFSYLGKDNLNWCWI